MIPESNKVPGRFSHLSFWAIALTIALIFFFANKYETSKEENYPASSTITGPVDNAAISDTSAASKRISSGPEKKGNLIIPFSPLISTPSVNDMMVDSRGTLWVATERGLNSITGDVIKFFSDEKGTFPTPQAECLAYDGQKIWVGTLHGLFSMTRSGIIEKHKVFNDEAGEIIWDVTYDGRTIWVGSQSGSAFMDKKGEFVVIDNKISNGGLRHNWCLNIIRFSNWFVATHDRGISFWNTSFKASNPQFWKNIDNAKSSIIRPISGLAFDGKHIWIASSKGVLYLTTPLENLFSGTVSNLISYTTTHGLPSNKINAIIYHRGAIWLGTNAGLARISDEKIQTISPANGNAVNDIRALASSGDILWMGTSKGVQFINTAMVE